MDVDELLCAVNRIENSPFPYGILAEPRKVVRNGFMAQVVDIGGQPLGLVEKPLSHRSVDGGEVLHRTGLKGETVPRHGVFTNEGRAALPLLPRKADYGSPGTA